MTKLRKPTARECERCDRKERWNDEVEAWRITEDAVGNPHCIHEWNIDGTFSPIEE
ncbi:HEWD family protein [Haloarchaeobius sp. TZWWS8]|uniref:HEWD family protein n=1 Tax=Haloarchaeobius sp. TZWWS8 TaxID=3446121 RepID=UPI003EBA6E35